MKKLTLIAIALLAMAPLANAAFLLESPTTAANGDTVTINLFSDAAVGDFTIVSISDGGAGGVASNATVNTGFDWAMFTGAGSLNTGAFLVENATGKTDFGSPLVSGVLYSFDYEVKAIAGTTIDFTINGNVGGNAIEGAALSVVPEPMTMGLMGLGGLFLVRRKKIA